MMNIMAMILELRMAPVNQKTNSNLNINRGGVLPPRCKYILGAQTAVDGKDLSVDKAGIIGCQEQNSSCQFLGAAQPLRGVRFDAFFQNLYGLYVYKAQKKITRQKSAL